MLKKRFRLHHPNDFARLRQNGQVYHHHTMLLSLSPNGLTYNRYGFITSRALGHAVSRNRARRQLREAVRQLHPHLQTGYDMVIVGKKPVVGKPFQYILRTLTELMMQSGCFIEQDDHTV